MISRRNLLGSLTAALAPRRRAHATAGDLTVKGGGGPVLVYSGPAADGNLIVALAGDAGSDGKGNPFNAGMNAITLTGFLGDLMISSGIEQAGDTPAVVGLFSGDTGQTGAQVVISHSGSSLGILGTLLEVQGRLGLTDRGTDPGRPDGGGILYAKAGALYWRGSSGTVTLIAPA